MLVDFAQLKLDTAQSYGIMVTSTLLQRKHASKPNRLNIDLYQYYQY